MSPRSVLAITYLCRLLPSLLPPPPFLPPLPHHLHFLPPDPLLVYGPQCLPPATWSMFPPHLKLSRNVVHIFTIMSVLLTSRREGREGKGSRRKMRECRGKLRRKVKKGRETKRHLHPCLTHSLPSLTPESPESCSRSRLHVTFEHLHWFGLPLGAITLSTSLICSP